ncbi:hypothetical protein KC992_04880 [Candidatus Saccharibacteria bacterium]|nr:hypothetical protein [Candidatus Saccharibacteria bacterium]MCA9328498.1 hypothetical protein [Candidatus Saccharibacteria bacterium]
MAPYHHTVNAYHKSKRARRLKKFSIASVVLVFVISAGVGIDWLITKYRPQDSIQSVESTATVQSSTINIFRNQYFQFQADRTWVEVPEQSTDTKFVFSSLNGPLVEHQLTVYVNEPAPAKLAATRVLPVELNRGRFKQIASIDKHCNNDESGLKNEPKVITFNQVTFNCDMGSNVYKVFVGIIGGTNSIAAIRPDGSTATYTIVYDDLRYIPSANQIESIVETFQIR